MRLAVVLLCAISATMLSGCSTYFQGTAPAAPGKVYVVGAKQGVILGSKIWLCPDKPGSGECEAVEVQH